MSEKMTLDEIVTRITDECPDSEYTHDALNALRHLATLPAAVPDTKDDIDAPGYYEIGEASAWAAGWNACREAMLTQRGNAQDAT